MLASHEPPLSYVEATLNFAHPDSETRLLDEADRAKSVRRFDPKTVRIHDPAMTIVG